jgi:NADP-dependent 3-hydroxy acid dehydrogenase YdfG
MDKELIIITGASSGIGLATAKAFHDKGYPLLLLARRLEKFRALEGKNVLCKKVDVTDLEGFKHAVLEAESKFGPAGCLINNAGIMLLGLIQSQDPNEWKQMYDVNVMGVLNGMHIVLPGMIQRKKGTIINVSSVAGRFTFPNHAAYCGTKYAVHAITESVRKEVAKYNVRLVIVAPGAVETELLSHTTSSEIKAGYEGWKNEMGGVLEANDIAKAIVYAYDQPSNVCVREVMVCATRQEP